MFSFECPRRKDEEESLEVLGCVDPAKAPVDAPVPLPKPSHVSQQVGHPRIE